MILIVQLIEDYLVGHPVTSLLEEKHVQMLRSVLTSFAVQHDPDDLAGIAVLLSYCNQELTDYKWPEPAIARIANKALEMYFERSQNTVSVEA
ncbi:hypothetical protein [Sphingobacterium corticibacter]|uniref:Uncharacterized protein n=1 Tax=Sphingobacterium corticibacter TaxID=2171749 RepID=A0A2T8HGH7_9SPHI|nr:hypothetical protein [Sphingobacterium corticibacter]PVH24547.1 hypothetical protein DC487_13510 [Sphingobacterium corticibacter]